MAFSYVCADAKMVKPIIALVLPIHSHTLPTVRWCACKRFTFARSLAPMNVFCLKWGAPPVHLLITYNVNDLTKLIVIRTRSRKGYNQR